MREEQQPRISDRQRHYGKRGDRGRGVQLASSNVGLVARVTSSQARILCILAFFIGNSGCVTILLPKSGF